MLADLDLLPTAVFCTADDLLPERQRNARRSLTDAEVATSVSLKRLWGSPLTVSFWRLPKSAQEGCFRDFPSSPASTSVAGDCDSVVLLDSTPVECGRSLETTAAQSRPTPADTATVVPTRAGFGACACTFAAPDGPPRASILAPAAQRRGP